MAQSKTETAPTSTRRRKIAFLVRYGLFLLLLVEICSRAFLAATSGVSVLWPGEMVYVYYPELKPIREAKLSQDDGYFDVLLLGGSVIDARWTDIDAVLQRRLPAVVGRPVRTHNLGAQAHTSRDSFFKYRHLRDVPFDLVVVYHGINEARLNHCPPEMFRADYSHYRWYAQVNRLESHREMSFTALPYAISRAVAGLAQRFAPTEYAPEGSPPDAWLAFGQNVKTAAPLRKNMTAILELARAKNETVVLMSFAYYVAPGYSKERFKNKELDYDRHQTPIEVWGTPETVVTGIQEHNRIVRELAAEYDNALFVDQAAQIPTGKEYYQDICHLTYAGAEAFVTNLLEVIGPAFTDDLARPASGGR
jgi:hypothetical protein